VWLTLLLLLLPLLLPLLLLLLLLLLPLLVLLLLLLLLLWLRLQLQRRRRVALRRRYLAAATTAGRETVTEVLTGHLLRSLPQQHYLRRRAISPLTKPSRPWRSC
jgi:hypothetical protein